MSARLRLIASAAHPEPVPAPRVRIVSECLGRRWAASPSRHTVYVLAGTPEEVGRAVTEAMSALVDRRPLLTTVGDPR